MASFCRRCGRYKGFGSCPHCFTRFHSTVLERGRVEGEGAWMYGNIDQVHWGFVSVGTAREPDHVRHSRRVMSDRLQRPEVFDLYPEMT